MVDGFGFGNDMGQDQFGSLRARYAYGDRQHAFRLRRTIERKDQPSIGYRLGAISLAGNQQQRSQGPIENFLHGATQSRGALCLIAARRQCEQCPGMVLRPAVELLCGGPG